MVKAIIFDVDGTLVDSVDLHAQAWQDAFHDFGHDIPFTDIRQQIGKGGDQLLPVFLSAEEIAAKGDALEEHRGKVLKTRYLHQITPFPAVRELFEALTAAGIRVALASSANSDELAFYKTLAGIDDLVEAETSSSDAERSKPHPDIFQAALDRLDGIDASEVVVVGDTPYDAEAAAKAGMRTIGLLCGGWSREALTEAGCVDVFQDAASLLQRHAETGDVTDQAAIPRAVHWTYS